MQMQDPSSHKQDLAPSRRKKALVAIAAAVVIGGGAHGAYYAAVQGRYESTDNAYVQGNLIQITPQVSGTVLSIGADDTDFVKAGQPLVRLDPADARVALDQATAQLAQAVREVHAVFVSNAALRAQMKLREAELAKARADLGRAQDDQARRAQLAPSGAVGKEELEHANTLLADARSAEAAAKAAVLAAHEQLAANETLTDNTTIEEHPNVQRAAARVREAYLALKRAELPAPADGYVAKRSVQVGQRVQPGMPLMAVVPLNDVWVDANFKEDQLRRIRIGQPATLVADVYGTKVEYHGKVAGLGAGTGSAFSLLPAQNATGNWIKIVQRVPVRIALQRSELSAHPLRVGLSIDATVDVRRSDGQMLAQAPAHDSIASTAVFDHLDRQADAIVRSIIAANAGTPRSTRSLAEARNAQ